MTDDVFVAPRIVGYILLVGDANDAVVQFFSTTCVRCDDRCYGNRNRVKLLLTYNYGYN